MTNSCSQITSAELICKFTVLIFSQNYRKMHLYLFIKLHLSGLIGQAVAQFVEALRYKPEGRGFDSRWCHWNFPSTQSFWQHYGPGGDSVCNRNEYQEYILGG